MINLVVVPLLALVFLVVVLAVPCMASISYTPLVTASDFAGVQADTATTAVALIAILFVVLGLSMIVRTIGR